MRNIPYRIFITTLNIFFPPLAVGLLDGFSTDCLVNSCLFLCGVIPSHIHGFYISCVYFARKRRVRKGRYPGGKKAFIYTDRVLNGGASNREVDVLWEKVIGGEKGRGSRARSPRSGKRRGGSVREAGGGGGGVGYTGSVNGRADVQSRVGTRKGEARVSGRPPQRSARR